MTYTNKYKFTLLGGDRRIAYLSEQLARRGHAINLFSPSEDISFFNNATLHTDYRPAIAAGEILLLPMPVSRDGVHLHVLGAKSPHIPLSEIFEQAKRAGVKHILGGHITKEVKEIASTCGIRLLDYSLSEALLQKNAESTAEGGIMIAMENTDVTLKGADILVGGFGRIAKHLCALASVFGARITVVARRDEVRAEAAALGYSVIGTTEYDKLTKAVSESRVIFNTVPATIFGERVLKGKSRAVYIELASCPGGIYLKAAREMGMNIVFAPSLPGRYSPESAGGYILDGIEEILEMEGMKI